MSERVRVAVRIKGGQQEGERESGTIIQVHEAGKDGWNVFLLGDEKERPRTQASLKKNLDVFQVDYAWRGEASQNDVWTSLEADVMAKLFSEEGPQYGVTIMAYGQTGSGKTYSMMGSNECKANPLDIEGKVASEAGIVLRMTNSIFERLQKFRTSQPKLKLLVLIGMVEIYNETIQDLLNEKLTDKLAVRENKFGFFVQNQSFKIVDGLPAVAEWLSYGYKHATIAATNMNQSSSRAHTLITLKIQSTFGIDDEWSKWERSTKVTFVDLAGSERSSATDYARASTANVAVTKTMRLQIEQQRKREGININQSLFALGMMMEAAQARDAARIRLKAKDSVLTKLLLDSIGGNTVSFLIVAVRDSQLYLNEIKQSLAFGQKAKQVQNKPKQAPDAGNYQLRLASIQLERDQLKQERDELMAQLRSEPATVGSVAPYIDRISDLLNRLVGIQDEMGERIEQITEDDIWALKVESLEKLVEEAQAQVRQALLVNESPCPDEDVQIERTHVKLPSVPFLLCLNPVESGVVVVFCRLSSLKEGDLGLLFGKRSVETLLVPDTSERLHISVGARIFERLEISDSSNGIAGKEAFNPSVIHLDVKGIQPQHCRIVRMPDSDGDGEAPAAFGVKKVGHGVVRVNYEELKGEIRKLAHGDVIRIEGDAGNAARFVYVNTTASPQILKSNPSTNSPKEILDQEDDENNIVRGEDNGKRADEGVQEKVSTGPVETRALGNYHEKAMEGLFATYRDLQKQPINSKATLKQSDEHYDLMISFSTEVLVNEVSLCCLNDLDRTILLVCDTKSLTGNQFGTAAKYAKYNSEVVPKNSICHALADAFIEQECALHIVKDTALDDNFSDLVLKSVVMIPLLTCFTMTVGGREIYCGSVGNLIQLQPATRDRQDDFLLEITIANALLEMDVGCRWLQAIHPLVFGDWSDDHVMPFDLGKVDMLSPLPSYATNKKAAEILWKAGLPVSESVLRRSVRENVKLILQHNPIQFSNHEKPRIAIQQCASEARKSLQEAIRQQERRSQLTEVSHSVSMESVQVQGNESDATQLMYLMTKIHHLAESLATSSQPANEVHPSLNSEYFHFMISYRVSTEGETVSSSNRFSSDLYRNIMLESVLSDGWSALGASKGRHPHYTKRHSSNAEGMARTFLDSYCLAEGSDWEESFSKAVVNSVILVPLFSCYKRDVDGRERYSGSIGQLVDWNPADHDRQDNFLLEITIANALMESVGPEDRYLQAIVPVLMGERDGRGYHHFDRTIFNRLSTNPSFETNDKAAKILLKNGIPVTEKMIHRSIQENVTLVMKNQGILLSEFGKPSNALDACTRKLLAALQSNLTLWQDRETRKEHLKHSPSNVDTVQEILDSNSEQNMLSPTERQQETDEEVKKLKEVNQQLTNLLQSFEDEQLPVSKRLGVLVEELEQNLDLAQEQVEGNVKVLNELRQKNVALQATIVQKDTAAEEAQTMANQTILGLRSELEGHQQQENELKLRQGEFQQRLDAKVSECSQKEEHIRDTTQQLDMQSNEFRQIQTKMKELSDLLTEKTLECERSDSRNHDLQQQLEAERQNALNAAALLHNNSPEQNLPVYGHNEGRGNQELRFPGVVPGVVEVTSTPHDGRRGMFSAICVLQ